MWWVNFRRGSELAGTAIIDAPSIYHTRLRLAFRGIGKAADYSEAKEVDAERAALIPRDCIGRLLLPDEAQKLRLLSPEQAFSQPG
jgi:hypothetical protein